MKKFRFVMIVVAVMSFLSTLIGWNIFTDTVNHPANQLGWAWALIGMLGFFVSFGGAFIFLAALIMLGTSLFRVHETPDGKQAYDPTNPWWRIMKRIWPESFKNNLTECKALVLTAATVFFGTMVITFATVLIFLIRAWSIGQFKPIPAFSLQEYVVSGIIFLILAFACLSSGFGEKIEKSRILYLLTRGIAYCIIITMFGTVSFLTGKFWMDMYDFSLIKAIILTPLTFACLFVVLIAIMMGFAWTSDKVVQLLNTDNLLKRYVLALKSRTCHFLIENVEDKS